MAEKNLIINHVLAVCKDCNRPIDKGVNLELSSGEVEFKGVAFVRGPRIDLCRQHHDSLREFGYRNVPQHNEFVLKRDTGEMIGQITVSSMAVTELAMRVEDPKISGMIKARNKK